MYLKGQGCNLLTETQKNNAGFFNNFMINYMLVYTFLQLTAPDTTIQESLLSRKSISPQQKKKSHLKGMDIKGRKKVCINNVLLFTMHELNFRRLTFDNGLLGASTVQEKHTSFNTFSFKTPHSTSALFSFAWSSATFLLS